MNDEQIRIVQIMPADGWWYAYEVGSPEGTEPGRDIAKLIGWALIERATSAGVSTEVVGLMSQGTQIMPMWDTTNLVEYQYRQAVT